MKSYLVASTLTFLLVIVSLIHGNAREISSSQVWSGDQFQQNELFQPKKPKEDNAILTDKETDETNVIAEALIQTIQKIREQSKNGKKTDTSLLLGSIQCILQGNCPPIGSNKPGSMIEGSSFNSNLETAAAFNVSSIVRKRRPTKYKIGTNCKNKPKKHSKEVDDEDNEENQNGDQKI